MAVVLLCQPMGVKFILTKYQSGRLKGLFETAVQISEIFEVDHWNITAF